VIFKPEIGKGCSFYHEGGHGEARWIIGWRFGIVRAIPSKGYKLGMVQIELPVPLWTRDIQTGTYTPRPFEKVWVESRLVNAPGDFVYHGLTADEILQERRDKKAAEQAKADKKKGKARRFNRA
jgi:hypothetical protein